MISQISSLVQGGVRREVAVVGHLLGGAMGGMTAGAGLALAGVAVESSSPGLFAFSQHVVLPIVWIASAFFELELIRGPSLLPTRQTQREWACALGSSGAVFVWGYDLGSLVTTRLPYKAGLVLIAFALLSGDWRASILVMTSYGLGRAMGPAFEVFRGVARYPELCDSLNRQQLVLRRGIAGLSALGGMLLAIWAAVAA